VDPAGITAFLDAVDRDPGGLHGFMLLRRGRVLVEGSWKPYRPDLPHLLFSLTKSFASTAAGLAVAEGRLTVDAPVLSFFPDQAPADPGDNLRALRVRHLLTMTAGHHTDPTGAMTSAPDGDWVRAFLAQPVEHEPGTHFVYNSGASHLLAAIVRQVTGQDVRDYLRPRLFEPLGIAEPPWETCPRGVRIGGWGLSLRLEDIAGFGQLYLQRGRWRGQQLLPEAWVAEATAFQVPNGPRPEPDWAQGYGYQFWRCRHGAFRGDGAFGQFCIVLPEQEAVIAILAGVGNMQAVLDRAWDHLLPAFGPARRSPANAARHRLRRMLAALRLPVAAGEAASPLSPALAGATYRLADNPRGLASLTCDRTGPDTCIVDLCTAGDTRGGAALQRAAGSAPGNHRLCAAHGRWLESTTTLDGQGAAVPLAASYGWTSPDTLQVRLSHLLTPFCATYTLRFAGDRVRLQWRQNVSFGPLEGPEIEGRRA
jgi:CubicO group peptidase (beta-lactamase class C family)